ncbi:response regulator transcription factor [Actinocrispum sp. NPDC049592]|uniref:helix-turn-helix transcriptional regulator n=1 Tax=Actinocrispum sp. NPDC049592 TaxID=3154835 RepID=UPI00343C9D5B
MDTVCVAIQATDPMTYLGLKSYLSSQRQLRVATGRSDQPEVVLFATDRLDSEAVNRLRKTAEDLGRPTVLVTGDLSESTLLTIVEHHVVAILPKHSVTGEELVDSVMAAARGDGIMPPDVLGQLLRQVEALQREVLAPNGLNASGLQPREVHILRLMADGHGTEEIANELRYSERTVKNVLYNLTTRLHLRNRAHAVAYALRAGVI